MKNGWIRKTDGGIFSCKKCLFSQADRVNSFRDYFLKKRRYVFFLYMKSLGNFLHFENKKRCNGLHATAWNRYSISVFKGFS